MAHQAAGRDRNDNLLDWLLPVTATNMPGAPPQGWVALVEQAPGFGAV